MLIELFAIGADIHFIDTWHPEQTPFLVLIGAFFDGLFDLEKLEDIETQRLPFLLSLWLECLQAGGVDLKQYGQKEMELREQGRVSWDFESYILYHKSIKSSVKDLVYGSMPSDWKLEIEYQFGEWRRRKLGTYRMPGEWNDDDQPEPEWKFLWSRKATIAVSQE